MTRQEKRQNNREVSKQQNQVNKYLSSYATRMEVLQLEKI